MTRQKELNLALWLRTVVFQSSMPGKKMEHLDCSTAILLFSKQGHCQMTRRGQYTVVQRSSIRFQAHSQLTWRRFGHGNVECITKALKSPYQPKLSEIVQRFKFNTCSRNSGETVGAYVAALWEIAQDCNCGDTLKQTLHE